MVKKDLLRWLPAFLLMAIIYIFSSIPSAALPDFGPLDLLVNKGGHMLGYGLLALSIWNGLRPTMTHTWLALFLTVLYALSDEFHQSFVPGRGASWMDALVIDAGAASIALGLAYWGKAKKSLD